MVPGSGSGRPCFAALVVWLSMLLTSPQFLCASDSTCGWGHISINYTHFLTLWLLYSMGVLGAKSHAL